MLSPQLREIKKSIKNENISYGEINYLQGHQNEVLKSGDIELAQWAGISESRWNKYNK